MKHIIKIAVLTTVAVLMFIADIPPTLSPPYLQLVPEAGAITQQAAVLSSRRRMRRRGVVIGASVEKKRESSAASSQQQAATAQQEAATAQQQSATAQQQSATAQQQALVAQQQAAGAAPLPLGVVVPTLPAGCTPKQVSGVEYQHCGANYYRTAFQGSNLVYVTAQPK